MKTKNSIKILKDMVSFYASFADTDRANALTKAVNKLNKELQIDVTEKENKYVCPECGFTWKKEFEKFIINYCPNCGQKIKYVNT